MTNYEWCELSGMTFEEIQNAYLSYCRKHKHCYKCPMDNEDCDCMAIWLYSDTKTTEDVEDN